MMGRQVTVLLQETEICILKYIELCVWMKQVLYHAPLDINIISALKAKKKQTIKKDFKLCFGLAVTVDQG